MLYFAFGSNLNQKQMKKNDNLTFATLPNCKLKIENRKLKNAFPPNCKLKSKIDCLKSFSFTNFQKDN